MNILVTGGLGGVGRAVVQRLMSHGHIVRILDRSTENPIAGAECIAGDLTDYNVARDSVRGMDAVIHLAALTHPAAGPAHDIFHINVAGTFNVYDAAAQQGIRRVVSASSINALGYNFGVHSFPIEYFPLDESHPSFTTDAYSFSKQTVEEIGRYFWRRDGISGVQLRLPFVYSDFSGFRDRIKRFFGEGRAALSELMLRPEAELREMAKEAIARRDEMRAARLFEVPWEKRTPPAMPPSLMMILANGYTDFWAIIGADDAAQAFEKGVTASYEGSHPLYACEAENNNGQSSALLARLFFPDAGIKRPLAGSESLVSVDRAARLIGFKPEGSFQRWIGEALTPENG
jgi:nucleoside-diphosphate-sugar epimerase